MFDTVALDVFLKMHPGVTEDAREDIMSMMKGILTKYMKSPTTPQETD